MNSETILVTGGGGFLGTYIIKELISNNYNVISFARNSYPHLELLGVKQIRGDLQNIADINAALFNVDAVIHTASKVGMCGKYQDFYNINYIGTKNLVDAMKKNNVNKLIYTSTPSVVFGKDDIIFGNETLPYPNEYKTYYAETKMLGEKYVLENANQNFLAVSLRPHLIFGNGDLNLIPRVLATHKKNKLKIVGDGTNLVDVIPVENAALAHVMALKKIDQHISGNAYFIGQGPVNLWNFINEIFIKNNLPILTKKIPLKIAYAIGFMIEIILKIFNLTEIHPPMSRFIALQLGKSHYFDHTKSIQDLGNYHKFTLTESINNLKS
jgi:nucleoside-diphosphate-sugar epimerase